MNMKNRPKFIRDIISIIVLFILLDGINTVASSGLNVNLYDAVNDANPVCQPLSDSIAEQQYWINLNNYDAADKVAQVVVQPNYGYGYRRGNHILLFDDPRNYDSDTVAIDPEINSNVNLNHIDFADKAAGLEFINNPRRDGGYSLRVRLYDRMDQDLEYPNLVFYDWEQSGTPQPINLNKYNFADKSARVIIDKGPDYRDGDRIMLWDSADEESEYINLYPGNYDLNDKYFADSAAVMYFIVAYRNLREPFTRVAL